MGSSDERNETYLAALKEDWEGLTNFYREGNLMLPVTISKDTAIHMAVYSGSDQPLKDLLDFIPSELDSYMFKNAYGNTALHEAATTGNLKAVTLLVDSCPALLETLNNVGETPLFKAAAFGRREIVKFLASRSDHMTWDDHNNIILSPIHRQRQKQDKDRKDLSSTSKTSILHIAVQGEHFETALELLKLDASLRELEDDSGKTCLQLLANMPSSFKSGYRMGKLKSILYFCLPNYEEDDHFPRLRRLARSIWKLLCEGLPMMKKIWEAKKKHEAALNLAESLIMYDVSWDKKNNITYPSLFYSSEGKPKSAQRQSESQSRQKKTEIPLLLATRHGILEIVKMILGNYPQAVEHHSHMGQNILHVAVKHRQKEIFDHVKEMRIPMTRLVRGIDNDGYTILHHAAELDTEGNRPGPALQLQAELKWFKRVQKHIPHHYTRHVERKGKTADELFKTKHKKQLEKAQKWIKETSQSCSAVAVLIATVVFAAAYTVPGGPDNNGIPIFLHSSFFLFFTIMDVVSLASSLTSVVMFLSILTSPCEQQDFFNSLPRKLTLGFTLLFFSVATTMLAFAATIVLIIRLNHKKWSTMLIYIAAFFPVTVFALMQFPLYATFMGTLKGSFKKVRKFASRLFFKKQMI